MSIPGEIGDYAEKVAVVAKLAPEKPFKYELVSVDLPDVVFMPWQTGNSQFRASGMLLDIHNSAL